MTEQGALLAFWIALGVMVAIGVILPSIAPGLISLLNRTVLTGEEKPSSSRH